jgi:hypothetical protein
MNIYIDMYIHYVNVCVMCIYVHLYTHIYIYIYIFLGSTVSDSEKERNQIIDFNGLQVLPTVSEKSVEMVDETTMGTYMNI